MHLQSHQAIPERLLLGPGPSNCPPDVLRAMGAPVLGYMDPAYLAIMDETCALLRGVFGTDNEVTFPVSGTGSAGMEAALVNVIEPEDRVVVASAGFFSQRMAEIARRAGAEVTLAEAPWGSAVDPGAVEAALRATRAHVLCCVHMETSTGVLQPLEPLAALARRYEALFVVDTVASLGGVDVGVDRVGIDVCYSGSQKCLSAPPGLAPVTFGPRALEAVARRRRPASSWYLDVALLKGYWTGAVRSYHHTGPCSMVYALREALRVVHQEGLPARYLRHQQNAAALAAGLGALGLSFLPGENVRSPTLLVPRVPEGVDEGRVRRRLLDEYSIEIAGGLGELRGKVWRIGLMGHSSQARNVLFLLGALGHILREEGHRCDPGAGIRAAADVYRRGDGTRV